MVISSMMIRLLSFDYKTDRYEHASQLVERYRGQLDLYAEALPRSYQIETVEEIFDSTW